MSKIIMTRKRSYSKDEIITELEKELKDIKKLKKLYDADCIKRKGTTAKSKELYSEIIAKKLMEGNIREKLDKMPSITRNKSYYTENHCNIEIKENNRKEENFAKRITGMELGTLGLIIDYQIPLKDNLGNKGLGKIDLISYNKKNKNLFLIELKYENNKETLLRAVLEIYTYYKIVDEKKLKKDFLEREFLGCVDPDEITILPAVLLDPKCNAYKELKEMEDRKRPKLKELSREFGIRFFTIEKSDSSVNEIKLQNP